MTPECALLRISVLSSTSPFKELSLSKAFVAFFLPPVRCLLLWDVSMPNGGQGGGGDDVASVGIKG